MPQDGRRPRWHVIAVFVDDDSSAFSGKPRPGYLAMLEAIKDSDADAILAWSPMRLIRHPRELEDFIDLLDAQRVEVATHMAGDYDLSTSGGRLVARVVGAVARHESEEKREAELKMDPRSPEAGRFRWLRRPYGYAKDGVTVVRRRPTLSGWMARRVLEGDGTRRVARDLNNSGRPHRSRCHLAGPRGQGQPSSAPAAPACACTGARSSATRRGPPSWTALPGTTVQATLTDPRRKQVRRGRYLLTGLLYSADGRKMTGPTPVRASRASRSGCTRRPAHIVAANVEEFVVEWALQATDRASLPKRAENAGGRLGGRHPGNRAGGAGGHARPRRYHHAEVGGGQEAARRPDRTPPGQPPRPRPGSRPR